MKRSEKHDFWLTVITVLIVFVVSIWWTYQLTQ